MDQNKPSKHKRLMLTFLVAIFVLPIIIAKVLIDTGMARDLATEQYGTIIEPAVDLNASESLKPLTKNGLAPSEWISFYFEPGGCQEECQNEISALQSFKSIGEAIFLIFLSTFIMLKILFVDAIVRSKSSIKVERVVNGHKNL